MPQAEELLGSVFGFAQFRPGQAEIVQSVLAGHNTLAIMPTGGGKSLCYQLPALCRSGVTVVISPLIALMRDQVRALHPEGAFTEVFVDTPLEVCEARDVKGLYAKARAGEIPDFSGISAPYEAPEHPEITVDTSRPLDECVAEVIEQLGI